MTSPTEIGIERFKSAIRDGVGQMPGFPEAMITAEQLDALVAYVLNPSAGVPKIAAVSAALPPQQRSGGNEEGPALLQRLCLSCHSHAEFDALLYERPQWQRVVEDMRPRGVDGSEEELQALVDFLAERYAPRAGPGGE